jgi:polyhydroxybutyrate depolymerase
MKRTIALILVLASVVVLSAWAVALPAGKYQAPGNYVDSIEVNGTKRLFTLHLPANYRPWTRLPLVVNIHGRTATAFQQEEMSQMNLKADQEGFIVVHPQAMDYPPTWWGPIPNELGQPDMDFFEQLLAYLQRELSIDPARIYATGFSNGATMANRLGCDMSDTFAAIAPVSGGHVAFDLCASKNPISVLVFHGLDDTMIPYQGNNVDSPPVRAWVQAWADRNGCHFQPQTSQPGVTITRETWGDCDQDVEVTFYSIAGAGHTWPGSQFGALMGGTTSAINATDVMWEFFESHPRPAER